MRRREFLGVMGGAAAAWPLAARAQQSGALKRVGVITGLAEDDQVIKSSFLVLRKTLETLGWIEGKNIQFVYRYAAGNPKQVRELASELIKLELDLIVAHITPVVSAFQQATRTLPIVFVSIPDPVANGFVASLARPGGNMTGFTNYEFSMGAKWLEILKEIAPKTERVALMLNPDGGPYYVEYMRSIEAVALSNSVQATLAPVRNSEEIEGIITKLGGEAGGGLIVLPAALVTAQIQQIIGLAARYRLPAIYAFSHFAKQGGLAAYGVDLIDLFRRAASYTNRILNGEKPADLPVQQPTKFEFVINLKTAKAMGLAIPESLLLRADEVIE